MTSGVANALLLTCANLTLRLVCFILSAHFLFRRDDVTRLTL